MEALNTYNTGTDTTRNCYPYDNKFRADHEFGEEKRFSEDKIKSMNFFIDEESKTETIGSVNNIILFPGTYTSSEVVNTEQSYESYNDSEKSIDELKGELIGMKYKLNKCIPTHAILYMILNALLFACSSTLLAVKILVGIQIIDSYYLYCSIIMSIGLFGTAFLSLRDWKEFLNSEGE